MATTTRKQIGNLLVEAGIITVTTLERALEAQKGSGKRLGAMLREMGIVTEEEVLHALARQSNLRIIKNFDQQSFDRELLDRVPAAMALEKFVFPLKVYRNMLALATLDPFDRATFAQLESRNGMKIYPVLATRDDILAAIRRHYPVGRWAVGGKQRIVLIDPSPIVANFLKPPLEKEGYEVFICHDGVDGLKLAYSCRPGVILCDLMMPRMDSYMFMYALKTHPQTINVPVVLMTSRYSAEEEHRARKAGFFDILVKPVMPARALVTVKKALAAADGSQRVAGSSSGQETPPSSPPPRSIRSLLRSRQRGM